MTQTVEAVYDGAVLRPETALELEPNTRVRLQVEVLPTVASLSAEEWRRGILETAGKWQGELERPEQGEYEQREPLS